MASLARWAVRVEKLTDIPREELRPDLYPAAREKE